VCCEVLVKSKTFYMVSFLLFRKLVEILNIVVIETISKIGCVMIFLLRPTCTLSFTAETFVLQTVVLKKVGSSEYMWSLC
jgi:hypothetical protein